MDVLDKLMIQVEQTKCNGTPSDKLIENNNKGVRFLLESQYTVDVLNLMIQEKEAMLFNPINELENTMYMELGRRT